MTVPSVKSVRASLGINEYIASFRHNKGLPCIKLLTEVTAVGGTINKELISDESNTSDSGTSNYNHSSQEASIKMVTGKRTESEAGHNGKKTKHCLASSLKTRSAYSCLRAFVD